MPTKKRTKPDLSRFEGARSARCTSNWVVVLDQQKYVIRRGELVDLEHPALLSEPERFVPSGEQAPERRRFRDLKPRPKLVPAEVTYEVTARCVETGRTGTGPTAEAAYRDLAGGKSTYLRWQHPEGSG